MATSLERYENFQNSFFAALSAKDFEDALCPLCPTPTESWPMFTKGTMVLHRCRCGLVFNKRQPNQDALDRFYTDSDAMHEWSLIKRSDQENARQREKFGQAIKFFKDRDITRMLDVGCGNGKFLALYDAEHKRARDLLGIEQNPSALSAARAAGVKALPWDLVDVIECGRAFQAVTLWGVLEHLKDPVGTLRLIHHVLEPGGYVLACVPNVNSGIVKTAWARCFTFCPQHLWYFNEQALNEIFKRAGYEPLSRHFIESEGVPAAKARSGLDPYQEAPRWAYEHAFSGDEPYKVVLIATKPAGRGTTPSPQGGRAPG